MTETVAAVANPCDWIDDRSTAKRRNKTREVSFMSMLAVNVARL
ncbi:MAG: hypothetical protein QOG67_131 [Verrucomicrobiota bacterium]